MAMVIANRNRGPVERMVTANLPPPVKGYPRDQSAGDESWRRRAFEAAVCDLKGTAPDAMVDSSVGNDYGVDPPVPHCSQGTSSAMDPSTDRYLRRIDGLEAEIWVPPSGGQLFWL